MSQQENTPHSKKAFIGAGLGHTAAVLESGELVMWGLARQYQLGVDRLTEKERRKGKTEADLPPPEDRHTPEVVPALKAQGDKVTSIACGSSHTLTATSAGHVFSWGSGAFGKLGHDDDSDVRIPRLVEFRRKRISRVACGPEHSAVVSEAGEVLTWGAGSYGNLGHGDNTDQPKPKLVDSLVGKRCVGLVPKRGALAWASGSLGVVCPSLCVRPYRLAVARCRWQVHFGGVWIEAHPRAQQLGRRLRVGLRRRGSSGLRRQSRAVPAEAS